MDDQLHAAIDELLVEYKRRIELGEQTLAALESGELRSLSGAEDTTQASIAFHQESVDAFRRGLDLFKKVQAGQSG